ncbi:MAG: 2-C-methyl-D-erythritol 2,4-cyclodiphosphate synthase [Armatimonadetes bacterium]|nr:2-C-methyl-D-erythritol 2,4-cyclodiphosphate synthase [Armatimonadota bacterium]
MSDQPVTPADDSPGPSSLRVGLGYDLHRLVEGRPLKLCGVEIDFPLGLLGHSDGDAALHAVADALLGACALGDLGQHFPDSDPAFAGADSGELLRRVVELVAQAGFEAVNVDLVILAEKPRLAPWREQMRESLATLLGLPLSAVSVKATTNEGLGPVGAGEAIAAMAVVLVQPRPRRTKAGQ